MQPEETSAIYTPQTLKILWNSTALSFPLSKKELAAKKKKKSSKVFFLILKVNRFPQGQNRIPNLPWDNG